MKKIVLISCVSKKLKHKARAEEIYMSPLFKMSLRYARNLNPDYIFILSAKHGLLNLRQEIEPYDIALNKMKSSERKRWAEKVIDQLEQIINTKEDEVIFLAGKKYREYITTHIKNYKVPMKHLGIGKQLKFLKENSK